MASRLVLDMGLHVDPDALARSDRITAEEADLRRQIYWALYCVDKLASCYTGRVCTMLVGTRYLNLPVRMTAPLRILILRFEYRTYKEPYAGHFYHLTPERGRLVTSQLVSAAAYWCHSRTPRARSARS